LVRNKHFVIIYSLFMEFSSIQWSKRTQELSRNGKKVPLK